MIMDSETSHKKTTTENKKAQTHEEKRRGHVSGFEDLSSRERTRLTLCWSIGKRTGEVLERQA